MATAPAGLEPSEGDNARRARIARRLAIALVVTLAAVIAFEMFSLDAIPGRISLVILTGICGAAMVMATLSVTRRGSMPRVLLAAGLLVLTGLLDGFLSNSGNDGALLLPLLAAMLLGAFLDDRPLGVAFIVLWVVGLIGAAGAYGVSGLSKVPGLEPLPLDLAVAGATTMAAYGLLWWVRDRLARAMKSARQAESLARESEAQARLARSRAERDAAALRNLVANSPLATIAVDLGWKVTAWNPAAARLFLRPEAEVIGKPFERLDLPHLLRGEEADGPPETMADDPTGNRTVLRREDGSEVQLEIYRAIQRDQNDRPAGLVIQVVDLTEREALRRRLSQLERMEAVGQLASGVAHDFNNLLTAVMGHAELLEMVTPADDERREDIEAIRMASERGARLVRELLAFGRRRVADPVLVDVNELLEGLRPMLERVVGSGVTMEIMAAPQLGRTRIDPGELEIAIVNLVVNARDAMPNGGRLTITTEECLHRQGKSRSRKSGPKMIRLSVRDSGTGMDPDTLAQAFEPFFSTKPSGQGSGLGLPTVSWIVQRAGGSIRANSKPGAGTLIEVELPRTDEAAEPQGPPPPELMATGAGEAVLIVDDDAAVRMVTRRALERLGYRVWAAANADEALKFAATDEPISLLVTDVVMPDVRGPVLAQRILKQRPNLPVLYVSGFASDPVARDIAEAGGKLLRKPLDLNELGKAVRAAIDSRIDSKV